MTAPKPVRVEDVLRRQLKFPGGHAPTDAEIRVECPTCGERQTLMETQVAVDGDETEYTCKNGCQVLVVIGKPEKRTWPGRGYRLGDHVIRNISDLTVGIGTSGLLLPASPNALATEPPKDA